MPRTRLLACILAAVVCLAALWFGAERVAGTTTAASAAGAATAARRPVRHEDPAAARALTDPAATFQWYLEAVSRFAAGRFQEGRKLVLRLDLANLPAEDRGLVRDLNDIVIKEGSILEAASAWVREASALIAVGRLEEARPLLEQLRGYIRRGEVSFDDAVTGFQELARRSNVEALPPEAPQRRAYEQLQRAVGRAMALLAAYGAVAKHPASVAAVGRLLPYQTTVSLVVPSPVYPGRPFEVSGTATERAPVSSAERRVTLRVDDQVLAEFPLGSFRRTLVLPEGTLQGSHAMTASVPAQGRYLGAVARRDFLVIQAVPDLRVQWPGTVAAPGRVEVSGSARSEFGHVAKAVVEVHIGDIAGAAETSGEGEFRMALDLPGRLDLVGPKTITVRLVPREPWHAPVEAVHQVSVINLVNAGLAATVLLPVGGAVYLRARQREVHAPHQAVAPAVAESPPPPELAEPAGLGVPATARDELFALYREALRLVQTATGMAMEPSATLREYARRVRGRLRSDAFVQVTTLVEAAFYSPQPVTPEILERAQRLRDQAEGELAGGAP